MIVADANLVLYLLLPGARTEGAEAVYERDPAWVVPRLCLSEVRNVLARQVRARAVTLADAEVMMRRAEELVGSRQLEVDSATVLRIAASSGLSAYDAEYLALAEILGVPLITEDRALHAAAGLQAQSVATFLAGQR